MRQAWESLRSSSAASSAAHPVYWLARMVAWDSQGQRPWADPDKKSALSSGLGAIGSQARRDLAASVLERRRAWLAPRERAGTARRLRLTARSDAVLWLASPGPLEVGLALHHLYGFPVLPGSSLKGLARRVAVAIHGKDCAEARYGRQEEAGPVAFLDGLPTGEWTVQSDVMTPHFTRWYRGDPGQLPDDTESPVPIGFLSIGAGSSFELALVARRAADAVHLDGVVQDLRRGLDKLGLGAKTAAGYGIFALCVESPPAAPPAAATTAPAATASRSAAAEALSAQISALRYQEVKGRLAAIAAAIERCPEHERADLVDAVRRRLVALGFRGREIRELETRYPILRITSG
ncbi:MAG TPA: type III-B CRISPR module RAMP protein Cmr6 [Thermodesulfobacteriota bacterium]|nr:type III-B CRISPR module RAMP protein Cmr6 [Thermodesulfobacteriota bacterium]